MSRTQDSQSLTAEQEIKRLRKIATDNAYMRDLAIQMLGPKGCEAMKLAQDKGIVRMHMSWGPDAFRLTGEERADLVLKMMNLDPNDCEGVSFDDLPKHERLPLNVWPGDNDIEDALNQEQRQ